MLAVFLSRISSLTAQTPEGGPEPVNGCYDGSDYVNFKNNGLYGGYTLQNGFQERAAQTYRYNGAGTLSRIRFYGEYPGPGPISIFTIPLRVAIYNVDVNGRPLSTPIYISNISWNSVN